MNRIEDGDNGFIEVGDKSENELIRLEQIEKCLIQLSNLAIGNAEYPHILADQLIAEVVLILGKEAAKSNGFYLDISQSIEEIFAQMNKWYS